MLSIKSFIWVALAALLIVLIGAGCSRAMAKSKVKSPYLTLFAFNYSDRYLYDTRVDGKWMGGVSAYTNGGSVMGPLAPRGSKPITLNVTWKLSGRYDLKTNTYEEIGPMEPRSAQVTVKQPYPSDPRTLLLHFYQDGRVEAELLERGKSPWEFRREEVPEGHIYHGK